MAFDTLSAVLRITLAISVKRDFHSIFYVSFDNVNADRVDHQSVSQHKYIGISIHDLLRFVSVTLTSHLFTLDSILVQ